MRGVFAFMLLLCCLLGACARVVRVEVSAFADPAGGTPAGKSCVVLPGGEGVSPDDLQFKEFAAQARASLEERGCRGVKRLEEADLAVLLKYGLGEPVIVEKRNYVFYRPWGRWSRDIPEFIPVVSAYVFNTGSVELEAREVEKSAVAPLEGPCAAKEQKPGAPASLGRQLWKVSASHIGERVDLRALFPWLIAAAKDYYGVDSGRNILVKIPAGALAPGKGP